ncbi:MAG: extracellular solute-binding protein [Proteobacteria bacterium]|nr:extracellular solute-binding protein [Pseudomonadota bacterium]MBU1686467.1 extracellular solute-binding protein [Pseudomonadota bacterium]
MVLFSAIAIFIGYRPSPVNAAHGVSIDGHLKYPSDFKQFDYTSAQAVKGGDLVLHGLGSFDKMNPFTLKGSAPDALEMLVFETLAAPSLDEPFAEYGLLAQDIETAQDGLSVTYTLDPAARFSDETPVTTEDVVFSLTVLKSDAAHPFYQSYLADIDRAEVIGPGKVRFFFLKKNRELHMIASQLPILSRKFYESNQFDDPTMNPPVGSGPYLIQDINPGKSITYRRNPKYWARDLPVRKNMFNFDTITIKYFKDQIVSVEAFKAHEFDFMPINIAKQWVRDLTGPRFEKHEIIKKTLDHKNNQGMQGFVFNLRRPLFQDRRVRQAIGLAFDFEWANQALFFDQYTRSHSFFSNSDLAATGVPQGMELEILTPFKTQLPKEVFSLPLAPPSTAPPSSTRSNLREANRLFKEAGWGFKDGVLTNDSGQPFEFEIVLVSPSFERVMAQFVSNLHKLGVRATYRTIDPALFTRRLQEFDYDMVVNVYGQSQSPGNEQRDFWHSSSADRKGAQNLIGLKDPVVDALVDKIIYAETREDLTATCKALDRVLWYGYYVVPNWYLAYHRVAYWNRFGQPDTAPSFYTPLQALMTWWIADQPEQGQ